MIYCIHSSRMKRYQYLQHISRGLLLNTLTTRQACADDRSKMLHKLSKMSKLLYFNTMFGITAENAFK